MMHPKLLPYTVAACIQPQNILVEHSVPLVLSPPWELPQVVVEIPIPHPEVEFVGLHQGHDLLDNNLGSLRTDQSKFLQD